MKALLIDIKTYIKGAKFINSVEPFLIQLLYLENALWALTPFVNIVMSGTIIDELAGSRDLVKLIVLAAATVGLNFLVKCSANFVSRFLRAKKNVFEDALEMTLSKKVASLDYARIESAELRALVSKLREDARHDLSGVWKVVATTYGLAPGVFSVLFATAVTLRALLTFGEKQASWLLSFAVSPWAALAIVAVIVGGVFLSGRWGKSSAGHAAKTYADISPFNHFYFYYLNNYLGVYQTGKDIRLYDQKELILSEQVARFGAAKKANAKIAGDNSLYQSLDSLISVGSSAFVFAFIGLKALSGVISLGEIVRFTGSINRFIDGFARIMRNVGWARANTPRLQTYLDFLALPEAENSGTLDVPRTGLEFEFRNVSFMYPGTDAYVLHGLNFKVKPGEKLAVVGVNGSGKTTMVKLLCRLYNPSEGAILLNGVDVREYKFEQYIRLFSVVFQDYALYSATLAQNVAAADEPDMERAKQALIKAGFGERLTSLEKGLDTQLYRTFDPEGIEVSGGEAQKIALARALYKDAPFVVLDEPTAALDPIAEFDIYSRFNDMTGGKSAIYISHRLSSCRFCDEVAVFDEGRIIQKGTHDALISEGGKYAQLWNAQAQYYAEKRDG
ncbi:MAG TPA: ABC transporter ATP-binding protein [Clostridia bacterium]|nr:ABC transporter ATP-binding protein [Clostridia bacterium]HPK15271.1 ABC transporter ATP-binding protein [Clostridia bacterium]